jgi:hypothetical protein
MIPKINQIVSVEPYKIVCTWSTNEVRGIDFSDWILEASHLKEATILKLKDDKVFRSVMIDEEQKNLIWPAIVPCKNIDGSIEYAPLDFSTEVLYQKSFLI